MEARQSDQVMGSGGFLLLCNKSAVYAFLRNRYRTAEASAVFLFPAYRRNLVVSDILSRGISVNACSEHVYGKAQQGNGGQSNCNCGSPQLVGFDFQEKYIQAGKRI